MKKYYSSVLIFVISTLVTVSIGIFVIFIMTYTGGIDKFFKLKILMIIILSNFSPLILVLLLDYIFYREKIKKKSSEILRQDFMDKVRVRVIAFFVAIILVYGLLILVCGGDILMFGIKGLMRELPLPEVQ
ncbi:MAG: hypothetical protein ACRCSK_02410 [Fusobacteriaceae bacterium]